MRRPNFTEEQARAFIALAAAKLQLARAGVEGGQGPASPAALAVIASRGRWKKAKHLAYLDRFLVRVESGRIRKLMIQMPPRHGKSELVSRYFNAWYLGSHPERRIIEVSYEAAFAQSWGRKARGVLERHGEELFGVRVKRRIAAAKEWELEGGDGGMISAGIGGPITGRGADILVVDDPVKNAEEAASITIQERNLDWYYSTARTRLEPGGAEILIMTRWHEGDLAGRLLAQEGHEWTVVTLPALAEQDDALGRKPGQALWSERYDAEELQHIRSGAIDPATGQRSGGIGSYFFEALYQQRPSPPEGAMFKREWWRRYRVLPSGATVGATFVDTAQDDKSSGDYCVLATWVRHGFDFYLTRLVRAQMQFPDLLRACQDAVTATKLPIVIEETPWSKPLIHSLQRMVPGVIPFKIEGRSKIARAQAVMPFVEAGNCYLPLRHALVGDFIEEHASFPNGAHDDMVDTTSMMGLRLGFPSAPQKPQGFALRYKPPKGPPPPLIGGRA